MVVAGREALAGEIRLRRMALPACGEALVRR
jgi:hypothetical protein